MPALSESGLGLPARLTLDEAGATLAQLRLRLADAQGSEVRLDAGQLDVFDSSAVAVLLELRRALQSQGKTLKVERWPQRLQALVSLYGVSELLAA